MSTKLFVSLFSKLTKLILIEEKTTFLKLITYDHTQCSSDNTLEYLGGLYLRAGWGMGMLLDQVKQVFLGCTVTQLKK